MRISDWSSDVCSSDLLTDRAFDIDGYLRVTDITPLQRVFDRLRQFVGGLVARVDGADQRHGNASACVHLHFAAELWHVEDIDVDRVKRTDQRGPVREIGRASCRERVCRYG